MSECKRNHSQNAFCAKPSLEARPNRATCVFQRSGAAPCDVSHGHVCLDESEIPRGSGLVGSSSAKILQKLDSKAMFTFCLQEDVAADPPAVAAAPRDPHFRSRALHAAAVASLVVARRTLPQQDARDRLQRQPALLRRRPRECACVRYTCVFVRWACGSFLHNKFESG